MRRETQHDKIKKLCAEGGWHCQLEFRQLRIWSPHKRRGELAEAGFTFEDRPCTHGIRLSKDYRLLSAPRKPVQVVEQLPNGHVRVTYV